MRVPEVDLRIWVCYLSRYFDSYLVRPAEMAPSAINSPMRAHEMPGSDASGIPAQNGQSDGIHLNSSLDGHLTKGHSNDHTSPISSSSSDDPLDLLCIGFGPASLAIAIALYDAHKTTPSSPQLKVLFLEKQLQFAWHAGMQLPGAKMQISFLKDLATPRDPTSHFTFLNYLFQKGRLNHFINLSTFLPTRVEYEDYLRWCAQHFEREGKVGYGMEVQGLRIGSRDSESGKVTSFEVHARTPNGEVVTRKARRVVIAVGGRPVIPTNMQKLKHVAHSSQFANTIAKIQERERGRALRFAVVGSGQSAAEIFNDLWSRFPDAKVNLVIKGANLRPSDDSPL
jgi:L-ornithine N5-monooxygenase